MSERLEVFVVCTPGLEAIVAAEIGRLGVPHAKVRHGGVEASVTMAELWSLNLRLRTATRVLVRLGRFPATVFSTLQAGLRRIDWSSWLGPGTPLRLRVTSTSPELFHTGAIAERCAEVLTDARFDVVTETASLPEAAIQTIHIRATREVVIVSLDTSGEALYRRGWRLETAKAPLRETLAAALVLHSGWNRKAPFIDPFCGSGTVPIEAALTARRLAAGRLRPFAFQHWASFDEPAWNRLVAGADADVVRAKATIVACDRDAGAIEIARANAERAGVADAIDFRVASISELSLPDRPGWLVSNPPYGHRVGGGDLRDLYDRFGEVLRTKARGWTVEVVEVLPVDEGTTASSPGRSRPPTLVSRLGLDVSDRLATTNGGIPINFVSGAVRPEAAPGDGAEG